MTKLYYYFRLYSRYFRRRLRSKKHMRLLRKIAVLNDSLNRAHKEQRLLELELNNLTTLLVSHHENAYIHFTNERVPVLVVIQKKSHETRISAHIINLLQSEVGYIVMNDAGNSTIAIKEFTVVESWQNRKIGRLLLDVVITRSRERGFTFIRYERRLCAKMNVDVLRHFFETRRFEVIINETSFKGTRQLIAV